MNVEMEYYHVIKQKTGKQNYLQDVWEEHEDIDNFSFTDDLSRAMKFYEYSRAPKYLWDDLKNKPIETLAELCEFFNAELVSIRKKTIWEVI